MGFFEKLRRAVASEPAGVAAEAAPGRVCTPVGGRVAAMVEVPDPVFARGVMGPGCAVWPEEGVVYAPVAGTVETAMSHAVGLRSDDGIEVLVHIGIDTVEMRGEGFEMLVRAGDRVAAGQPLVRVDREKVRAAGHPDCVVVVVTNADEFGSVELTAASGDAVRAGAPLLQVAPAA